MTRIGKGIQAGELWDRVILSNGMLGYIFSPYLKELPGVPQPPEDTNIYVTDIFIEKEQLIILKNNEINLIAKTIPENATNPNILWESSNENIVIVDATGKIKGISKGTAQIIVKTEEGSKAKVCEITVTELEENEKYQIMDTLRVNGNKISKLDLSGLTANKIKEQINNNNLNVLLYNLENIELVDTDTVGTGTKVVIQNNNNETISEYILIIYGDLDGDGQISSIDLLKLQRHILELSILKSEFEMAADTSKSGASPTSIDLLKIQRHILELKLLEQ